MISRTSAQISQEFVSGECPTAEVNLDQNRMSCQKYFQAKIQIVSKQLDQMLRALQDTQGTDIFGDLCQTVLERENYI